MKKKKKINKVEEVKTDKKTDYIFAIFLIFLGFVLLLNTTGVIEWSVWTILWRFWPLLVVFAGLNLIFEGSKIFSILLGILAFVCFIMVLVWSVTLLNVQNISDSWNVNVPNWFNRAVMHEADVESNFLVTKEEYIGVERKNIEIDMGVGSLSITNEGLEDHLNLDSKYFYSLGEPKLKADVQSNVLDIKLDLGKEVRFFSFGGRTPEYSLILGSDEISTDLNLVMGAGKTDLFLRGYNLETLSVQLGAGDIHSKLFDMSIDELIIEIGAGNFLLELNEGSSISEPIIVKLGAGRLTLNLPEGVEYKLDGYLGVGSIKTPQQEVSGLGRDFEGIKSEGYDSAQQKIDIVVEVGVGELVIK